MNRARVFLAAIVCLTATELAPRAEAAAQTPDIQPRAALYRIFLTDDTSAVSYGEYARVGDEVVFSMPVGGAAGETRLHLVTLPAAWVDWTRTQRYATSVKYQRYVETRAESDFAALSAHVTALLSDMAQAPDPERALSIADDARLLLSEWPADHFGYRQDDVREIVALIDEVMSGVGAGVGRRSVQLSLIATPPPVPVEPILGMPDVREQIAWLVTLAHRTLRPEDRTALLRAALGALADPDAGMPSDDAAAVRRSIESQLRQEQAIDDRYTRLSTRLVAGAHRAADRADVEAVERLLATVAREDERLGGRRPQVVHALRAELEAQREAARDLQRRRNDWRARRGVYRTYVERVSVQAVQLVKARGTLEAIRDGARPAATRLLELQDRLAGGVARLEQTAAPEALRAAHDMLVGAWRFAEHAAGEGRDAAGVDDPAALQRASSAAAGSLMLLARAQEAMRAALEPPTRR
jgi:hypothetical protein